MGHVIFIQLKKKGDSLLSSKSYKKIMLGFLKCQAGIKILKNKHFILSDDTGDAA